LSINAISHVGMHYPVALGTLLIGVGIICIKSVFKRKHLSNHHVGLTKQQKPYIKITLVLTGMVCLVLGLALIINTFYAIY